MTVSESLNLNNFGTFLTGASDTSSTQIVMNGAFNNQAGAIAWFNTFTRIVSAVINSGTANIAAGATVTTSGFNLSGGILNIAGSLSSSGVGTDSGIVNFLAINSGAIFQRSSNSPVQLNSGAAVNVAAAANSSSRQVYLPTNGLVLSGTANNWTSLVNLNNNDLDLPGGKLMNVSNQAKQGFNGGGWNGAGGIISTSAGNDTTHLTALGVIQNNQSGVALFTVTNQFDAVTPGAGDILVKYTYFGDANLDGKVDGSDYSLIDSGLLTHKTGWLNGDFNYDFVVNGSDYTLIDNAFNQQGAQLTAQVAATLSVPEPVWPGLIGLGIAGLRRRR